MKNLNSKIDGVFNDCQIDLMKTVSNLRETIRKGIQVTSDSDHACLIDEGEVSEGDFLPAYIYLNDILDFTFKVNSRGEYMAARLLVTFGGPNIYIDLETKEIQGYWGTDEYCLYFGDSDFARELDQYMEEIFEGIRG